MMNRKCKKCGETKNLEAFKPNKGCKHGKGYICKTCHNKQEKIYAEKSGRNCWEVYKKNFPNWREITKDKYLQRQYGITKKQYDEMYENQEGHCLICDLHQSELKQTLAVDHNHDTGEVRGLLCLRCNTMLGWFETYKKDILDYLDITMA